MNRVGKRMCGRDGFKCPHTPRARRGLVPGIFACDRRARHNLKESGCRSHKSGTREFGCHRPAQSAGIVSRRRKLLGEVIHQLPSRRRGKNKEIDNGF
jgi:hypothetical protein